MATWLDPASGRGFWVSGSMGEFRVWVGVWDGEQQRSSKMWWEVFPRDVLIGQRSILKKAVGYVVV